MTFQTLNPATGKIERTFPFVSDEQVAQAVSLADETFRSDWRLRSVAERAVIMKKAAALLREREQEFATYATVEMGKLIGQSLYEVRLSADILEYYADNGEAFLADRVVKGTERSIVAREPVGVLFAVEPWNFPYYQLARVAGPQLVAGNVVIFKHAPSVPQCALAFARLFEDAGAPAGVYTNLFCSVEQSASIIDDFRVRGVTLTGSELAGSAVAERAGKKLKKVVLELGGSDPMIVLPDAPVEKVIAAAASSRMMNMGQACVSTKRVIVVGRDRSDVILEGLRQAFSTFKAGDPLDAETTLGPLFSERALTGLLSQIDAAVSHGARVVCGGRPVDRPGFYLQPTIITDISHSNPLFTQETFGPVLSFYAVDTEQEALEIANGTPFGLGASVFSADEGKASALARRIDAGMVYINSGAQTVPQIPFGGVKNSGFGRELGELGIEEFLNHKLIRIP